MYYRLATWYFRFEKKGKISYGASILVSLSQVIILTDILGFFLLEFYEQSERQIVMDKFKPVYIILLLAIAFLNDFRFKNKYDIYKEKWENQSKKEKNLYGLIIFLLLIIPLIFAPIILNLFDYS
ncbi:MAG: hypothetical protein B6D64_12800 [Bacteroidetes bacterium 4484_276]|nr:MAG: hypothetical protein B6D64_12800 [Bacteroidetes bacterium 4484_276]